MDLREYLFYNRLTIKEFAQVCDYSPEHISGYISGRFRISKKLMKRISEATGNQVTMDELISMNPKESKKYGKKEL